MTSYDARMRPSASPSRLRTRFRSIASAACLAATFACAGGWLVTPASAQAPQGGSAQAEKKDVRPAGLWYGVPNARPKAKGALRLATYNVENLFDPFDDPTLSGEYDDIDEVTREVRVRAIAEQIRKLDADVLCLEEVESEACLRWFRDTYLEGMGYDHLASRDVGYYRGVEQSVLSRVPIERVSIFEGDDATISDMEARRTPEAAKRVNGTWSKPQDGAPPERFQRSPLRVDLRTEEGYALTVFVVHFKAGRFDHQRELEALQVEAFVGEMLERNPDANVAVLGDFNATPNQMATKSLRMSPLGLVSAYDWRFDKSAGYDLYNTHASGRAIDFIVMSPGLAADCVDASYFVLATLHAASDWDWRKADEIPPPDGYASDHCPVAIDFLPSPDRPASAFVRKGGADDAPEAPRRPQLRSDATPPTAADLAAHAKPSGKPDRKDEALAKRLADAGWEFVLPAPKSKTAKWSLKGGNSTWWPGFWWNAKTGATSRATPAERDGWKGDGKDAPAKDEWTKGGAPDPVGWVEWLSSEAGRGG